MADRHLAMHKTESGHRETRENFGGLLSISCNLQLKCSLMTGSAQFSLYNMDRYFMHMANNEHVGWDEE